MDDRQGFVVQEVFAVNSLLISELFACANARKIYLVPQASSFVHDEEVPLSNSRSPMRITTHAPAARLYLESFAFPENEALHKFVSSEGHLEPLAMNAASVIH